jgi:aminoglycoside phosphotransferase (APT) family kinase protein
MAATPRETLPELLRRFDLDILPEHPFPTDGWSGATFSIIERDDQRFVLKRTSPARDWIVRATGDTAIREAWIADRLVGPTAWAWFGGGPVRAPYLGTATDDDATVVLMPDLSSELIAWDRPEHDPVIDRETLRRVVDAMGRVHATPWATILEGQAEQAGETAPWCPLAERLLLLSRPAAQGYAAEGNPVGERFLAGWDAFDRLAPAAARDLVGRLALDISPLAGALEALPKVGLHGDLKLANVALMPRDEVGLIDWQMTLRSAVAVDLGWFLVANSAALPLSPDGVVDGYLESLRWFSARWGAEGHPHTYEGLIGDPDAQRDLTWIVGLVLRGWRKGLDAEARVALPNGMSAAEDLAWWSERAVAAAERRL